MTNAERPGMGTRAIQSPADQSESYSQDTPDTPPRYGFGELLDLLGHVDDYHHDQVAVCWKRPDGSFTPELKDPEDAPRFVDMMTEGITGGADFWFQINPVSRDVTTGRGTAKDVTRLAALYADLDVKPGACPDLNAAHSLIEDLGVVLGERPGAVIHSGHGLQPIWPIDRESGEELSNPEAQKLLRRFGRLVAEVAAQRGSAVDSVFDLPRVLRVPGTVNNKDPAHPVPAWCAADTGKPLRVEQIRTALDDYGLTELASDAAFTGEVISTPDGWEYGTADCPYVITMVEPWDKPSDEPRAGRHQWAMSRAVRLAAAHRLGCITEDGLRASLEHLARCLDHWCTTVGIPRDLHPDEVGCAYGWAVLKVATFTDEQTRRELGEHTHHNPQDDHVAAGDPFDDDVAKELHRLRVREAAHQRFAAERDGPAPPFDAGLLDEMLARPAAPPYRVDRLMPADGGMLVVAQRKTGKTTLMLNLARSLLTREPFLGTFSVVPVRGRVAVLNYEVSGAQLSRWADGVGVPTDRLLLVNLRGRRDPLAHDDDRKRLADLLRHHEVESLIVDPFGRAYSGTSQNDPGEVGAWLVGLDAFTRSEVGAHDLILTAHAGWNGERTRGSSALEDWADSIVTMTAGTGGDEGSRYLRALGRDVSIDEDRLRFDPESRLLSMTGAGSRKQATTSAKVEALAVGVCDYLESNAGAVFGDIKKAVEGREGDIRSAVELAENRGLIRRDVGGPGKATKHFRVDPIPPESAKPDGIGLGHD
ncbi:MAG: hypothetical protein JWR34_3416 [Mycobacterium sp.]|nr:hypothetical protein [Mycobacterium sp.]